MSSLLLVVTGASQGLGMAVATAFCEHYEDVRLIRALLVARSQDGLDETKKKMQVAAEARGISLETFTHSMDLSDLGGLDENIDILLEQAECTDMDFDRVVLINNAGSLGHLGQVTEIPSLRDLQHTLDFNVTSCLWLSIRFARAVWNSCVIVNISSLCAIEAFPTMGLYCTGKAARDMFQHVWATELGETSNVKLLNYAPGALDTEMTTTLRTSAALSPELQKYFGEANEKNELIAPEDTARCLVQLVCKNEFENGSHVDYWDVNFRFKW